MTTLPKNALSCDGIMDWSRLEAPAMMFTYHNEPYSSFQSYPMLTHSSIPSYIQLPDIPHVRQFGANGLKPSMFPASVLMKSTSWGSSCCCKSIPDVSGDAFQLHISTISATGWSIIITQIGNACERIVARWCPCGRLRECRWNAHQDRVDMASL